MAPKRRGRKSYRSKLSAEQFEPASSIGQHLLIDEEILSRTAELIPPGDLCVEIGAGTGALTKQLLERDSPVIAYEIDRRCQPYLGSLALRGQVEIRWQNFLEVPSEELNGLGGFHIVGNIPYHISEPLLIKLVDIQFDSTVMLVGDRFSKAIQAKDPTSDAWSRISMIAQGFFDSEVAFPVPREAFTPVPRADGAVIRQTRKEAGPTNWQSDPLIQSYRAITQANMAHTTLARALKNIMVNADGRAGIMDQDHVRGNRRIRRAGRTALRQYAQQYNCRQLSPPGSEDDIPVVPEPMLSIVSRNIDEKLLSRPLSGLSNNDLRKVCAVISNVANRRANRHKNNQS